MVVLLKGIEPFERLIQLIEGPNIKVERKQKGTLWVIAQRCGYLKAQADFMQCLADLPWIKSTKFQSGWVADGELIGSICTCGSDNQGDIHILEILFLSIGWPLEILARNKYSLSKYAWKGHSNDRIEGEI